jgi:hypothetical protein
MHLGKVHTILKTNSKLSLRKALTRKVKSHMNINQSFSIVKQCDNLKAFGRRLRNLDCITEKIRAGYEKEVFTSNHFRILCSVSTMKALILAIFQNKQMVFSC